MGRQSSISKLHLIGCERREFKMYGMHCQVSLHTLSERFDAADKFVLVCFDTSFPFLICFNFCENYGQRWEQNFTAAFSYVCPRREPFI